MYIKPHPGEILNEEYLKPLGLSARQLALHIGVPANRLTEIIRGRRGITADTAHRLGKHFKTTPRFWMNLQSIYDLSVAEVENAKEYQAITAHMDHPITA